jgi:hypothetical protein
VLAALEETGRGGHDRLPELRGAGLTPEPQLRIARTSFRCATAPDHSTRAVRSAAGAQ